MRAAHDHSTHLQNVCDGGSRGQPPLQVHRRPRALDPLGQPRRKADRQHVQNRLLRERLAGHPQGLRQGAGREHPL